MPNIANTAVVHPNAEIGDQVEIDPMLLLVACKIGEGTKIGAYVVLEG